MRGATRLRQSQRVVTKRRTTRRARRAPRCFNCHSTFPGRLEAAADGEQICTDLLLLSSHAPLALRRDHDTMRAVRALLLATIIATTTAVERVANVILVGGNLTLGSRSISLAQYDVAAREWSDAYEPQLYVYGETGKDAAVYGMAANRSGSRDRRAPEEAIVVGQFDSISETSQSQYCSVGRWTGMRSPGKALARVGDGGLCSRASDPATRIFATTLGRREELFVGGAFSSRVWDGAHFVKVEHVARFDSRRNLWMPLRGGSPSLSAPCGSKPARGPGNASAVSVLALAYLDGALFVGGRFDALGGAATSPGLVAWTEAGGLQPFPGGGLARSDGAGPGVAHSLAVDAAAGVLYVGGFFDALGPLPCDSLGAFPWKDDEASRTWTCLHDAAHGFATSKAPLQLLYDGAALFVAGYPAEGGAWWAQHAATAAIARFGPDAGYDPPAKRPRGDDDERDPKAKHRRGPSARRRAAARRPAPAPRRPANGNNGTAALRAATWEWLPGWRGANGTVLALAPGVGSLAGSVVVGGDFDGGPPVVVWRRDDTLGPYTMGFAGVGPLGGTVTAVTSLYALRPPPRGGDAPPARPSAVFVALLSGTCLLVLAVAAFLGRSCKLSAYGYGSRKPPGISLQTLSYGFAPDLDFEFSDAYEHAMRGAGNKHIQHDFNMHVFERFRRTFFTV